MSAEAEAYELNRRAAAINDLLRRIGASDGSATKWWNHRVCKELGAIDLHHPGRRERVLRGTIR
jgi:hypothetical protein